MGLPFDYERLSTAINENKVKTDCPACNVSSTSTYTVLNVPHFKELLLMLFNCDNCGYRDNEIHGNGVLQPKGVKFLLQVQSSQDLNRQIVLSAFSSVVIVDLGFEFPRCNNRSIITTIEGLIGWAIKDLTDYVAEHHNEKLVDVINTLKDYASSNRSFKLVIDDPSGNSYIEYIEGTDNLDKSEYTRTDEQTAEMGYSIEKPESTNDDPPLFELQTKCPHCSNSGVNKICQVDVPGFHECIIFSFTCEICGAKSTEVKPGGPILDHGQKWSLTISQPEDLNRDIILSDMASISIPSIRFVMEPGSLGGVYTTVEGILLKMAEHLETSNPFMVGDSANDVADGIKECSKMLKSIASLNAIGTIMVLDDPTSRSFIAPIPGTEDTRLVVEKYTRTPEQDEELGLLDMNDT